MADLSGAQTSRLHHGVVVAVCKDTLTKEQTEEITKKVRNNTDQIRRGFMAADPRNTGRVSKMSFRKVLYFAAGLDYSIVNAEVSTVEAPSGFVAWEAWMREYLVDKPAGASMGKPRLQPGIADDARPEVEVVEEVRQMVCDNFDDVMEAFRSLDPDNKGQLSFDEFTRAVLLGLRMTRMTAHHRAAIFHHAKKVKDTDDVDYADWLQLFAPAHLQQREMERRQAPTLRPTTRTGLAAGAGTTAKPVSNNSVAQLIEQLKSLTPSEAVAYLEGLNLSEPTKHEILAALNHVPVSLVEAPVMTGQPGEVLIHEVMTRNITAREKMIIIKGLPVAAELRVDALETLERENRALLQATNH